MAPKLDATANTLRLEYELDSVDKAATITKALNTGYDARPWQLESVSAATAPLFRGPWVGAAQKTVTISNFGLPHESDLQSTEQNKRSSSFKASLSTLFPWADSDGLLFCKNRKEFAKK
jgi:hypothetical protein